MKHIQRFCSVLLLLAASLGLCMQAQSYAKLWKQVEQAQQKSLPQTVIKLTDEIYRKGVHEQNAAQMLKAYTCLESYQEQITPDSLYANLSRLERWTQTEQNPVTKAILHSLLAQQYASYMQQNSYALQMRTVLDVEEAPADMREWSAAQFIAKIEVHNRASLQDSARLLDVSAQVYVPFVLLEEGSRLYQHDMYHLLASRAIATYKEMRGFNADALMRSHITAVYEAMINAYRTRTGSEDALLLCTLHYEEWRMEAGQPYPTYRQPKGFNEDYLSVLNELISTYGSRQLCAEVYIQKAIYLRNAGRGRNVELLNVCNEGLKRYPLYKRIGELQNMKERLLQPQLNVALPSSLYPGDSLAVYTSYRNIAGFTLKVYSTGLSEVPFGETSPNLSKIKELNTLHEAHYSLRPLPVQGVAAEELPYLSSDSLFKFPAPASEGVYVVQVIPDDKMAPTEERFLITTRFKVLTLPVQNEMVEVVTLDALTGQPIGDAKVSFYTTHQEDTPQWVADVTTSADGKALMKWQRNINKYVARKGADCAMLPQYVSGRASGWESVDNKQNTVTLLTDRSLYRPGQTIYLKGIAYTQNDGVAQVIDGCTYQLRLLDVSHKEVARKEVSTNEFGSFATEFVLPTVCLNGTFRVEVANGNGSTTVRVEEYKRPTFEVLFQPIANAYRLGDTVLLRGNVKAYNGSTVQNMPLVYTVHRSNRWNYWGRDQKPLLADTLQTDATGCFSLPIHLEAPDSADVYFYHLEATVTDEAGETQSASCQLLAGPRAYRFQVDLPNYICKEDTLLCTFNVTNQQDVVQEVKGIYRLYYLPDGQSRAKPDSTLVPVYEASFQANTPIDCSAWRRLASGNYRLTFSVRDAQGREESEVGRYFLLFSKQDSRPPAYTPQFFYLENKEFDATQPASFLYGTSLKDAYVLLNVFGKHGRLESKVLQLSDTIARVVIPYKEAYGQQVRVNLVFVKNGRMLTQDVTLDKRQPSRTLQMKWEVFRDGLRPGQKEEWKLVIKTPQGVPADAEMLATMYDASLDKIFKRNQVLQVYFNHYVPFMNWSESSTWNQDLYFHFPLRLRKVPVWAFDRFYVPFLTTSDMLYEEVAAPFAMMSSKSSNMTSGAKVRSASQPSLNQMHDELLFEEEVVSVDESTNAPVLPPAAGLRTNFAETAFFYPQLRTNQSGEVVFSFTMPQSLTRWNFRGYSHTKNMMTGALDATAVTSKEFMLSPNMPRFVRVGDRTQIAAGIANLTTKDLKGTATLTLFDPMTEKVIATHRQGFAVEAGKNTSVNFRFDVTDRFDLLGVRIIADGGTFSDGEQHLLPVLSNKIYLTETLSMPIRGEESRSFSLDSLFNRNSRTATNRRLTVEFTGNPAWYAVQALPVLSQPITDNAISWATAFYANSLAGYVANSQPRIKTIFDRWKAMGGSKETLLSQLAKNQELKNILLEESPWLLEATNEAQQQARIATLFDVNQLNNRNLAALLKLKELQGQNGTWSWYNGMSGSRYITGYITQLIARLGLLTKQPLPADAAGMLQKSFDYLHREALAEYHEMRKAEKSGVQITTLSGSAMEYLYLLAISDQRVPDANQGAYRYFLSKVDANLVGGEMACKAQSAIILLKAGRTAQANAFIASLKEHLVQTNEMGAHFAFYANPYSWSMLPVSVHVDVMEALRMAGGNEVLIEEMKLWLLKQKQATSWSSAVTTADAVYALFCQGDNLLESRGDVRITLGNKVIETYVPAKTTVPGLGYVKETFTQDSPELKAKSITVEKRDAGIAWGAVYAQFLAPIADVKQQGDELNVEKKLYVERIAADGQKSLQPITAHTPLAVGDKVVSRLTIRLDRVMDFVQLKDQRGACFEPLGTLSGYRWNSGCSYYVEVEDAATNFFFDRLDKGVYVLEYSYRVARGGTYEIGLSTLQSAYAPEYASHSAGGTVTVK